MSLAFYAAPISNNNDNDNNNINNNDNDNNHNNHNNNELLLPDNKDVLYRNINDIKSDNSIYNTFLESNKRESLELNKELINLKQKKKNKSYSYSSIYSTDTDDIEGDTDYIDVFQTSKSL